MTVVGRSQADTFSASVGSKHFDYTVFGGTLRSALPFPELAEATSGEITWTFEVVSDTAPIDDGLVVVGERTLGPEHYTLRRSDQRLRLEYSHAGVFDISRDGSTISWYYRPDTIIELVRSIVLGPALAIALEQIGVLCLHGSAVSVDDRVIAFVGPKHHGKSTIAAALTAAGARLVGDDLVPVSPGPSAIVRPGVPSVRLWNDSASALAIDEHCETVIAGIKTTASGFSDDAITQRSAPLVSVYVLAPAHSDGEHRACWRTRHTIASATIALAQQAKLADGLIGLPAAGARLRAAAAVAATVPIWTLHVVRDFSRIDELVAQVIAWTREDGGPFPREALSELQ